MFEKGDFVWCYGGETGGLEWDEDWGIVIKVRAGYKKNKYTVRWLYDGVTHEDYRWLHKHCKLMASAK